MAERSQKVQQFIDKCRDFTAPQLGELIEAFEDEFKVSPAPVPVAVAPSPADAPEEKTSFDVVLKEIGANKIQVIKEVRAVTSLGLKEAKELVDKAPGAIKEGVSKDEAEELKAKIEAAGAVVELK